MPTPILSLQDLKGIVLDWDGVIAETSLNFNPIREKYFGGRKVPLLEEGKKLPHPQYDSLLKDIEAEEMRGAQKASPVDGAFSLITILQEKNVPWCILSRNCRASIDLAAQIIGFTLPTHVFSRESPHVKPHPSSMKMASHAMGVDVSETLMIGDFMYDLQTARRAGARAVLVQKTDPKWDHLADGTYPKLTDLVKAYSQNHPLIPWEYHDIAQTYGASWLNKAHNLTMLLNGARELWSEDFAAIDKLAGYGIGAISLTNDRPLTYEEWKNCGGIPPECIDANLSQVLQTWLKQKYPLLKILKDQPGEEIDFNIDPCAQLADLID